MQEESICESLCVLIPSYNEAKTIGQIIKGLKERSIQVYVVDDGSVDDTASIAESEGAEVIRHKINMGKGASLREAFSAILRGGYDACIVMDGDGQHKLEDIDFFLKRMRETDADIVVGNRMQDTVLMPYIRILTNRLMSSLISKISGQRIPDTQCGFRLIKRKVLDRIRLESSNYEIESELILKAAKSGFKIESVPIKTVYQGEASRIRPILDTIRFIMMLTKTLTK